MQKEIASRRYDALMKPSVPDNLVCGAEAGINITLAAEKMDAVLSIGSSHLYKGIDETTIITLNEKEMSDDGFVSWSWREKRCEKSESAGLAADQ